MFQHVRCSDKLVIELGFVVVQKKFNNQQDAECWKVTFEAAIWRGHAVSVELRATPMI